MRKLFILLLLGSSIGGSAQSRMEKANTHISLRRNASDTITLKWWPELLNGTSYLYSESHALTLIGASVAFDLQLAADADAVYFILYKGSKILTRMALLEKGDSVTIDLTGSVPSFAGKGYEKHWLQAKVDTLFNNWRDRKDTVSETLAAGLPRQFIYPALITNDIYNWRRKLVVANNLLDSVRRKLSPKIYEWIKTDMIGKEQENILYVVMNLGANFGKSFPVVQKDSLQKKIWDLYLNQRPDVKLPASIKPMFYISVLMKEMNRTPLPQCARPFEWINSNFSGEWRDRLLTTYLECYGRDVPDSLIAAYDFAIASLHYRNRVSALLNRIKPGQPALAFELTGIDGKPVKFEQFKGKAIVLDFWFTGCSGCKMIAPSLHQIAEYFKGDDRIAFISVSTDTDRNKWIASVKSGQYSAPPFIQTYTGGLGADHALIKEYAIRSSPSIIILDRDGKFYSSKLPESSDSTELEKFRKSLKALL